MDNEVMIIHANIEETDDGVVVATLCNKDQIVGARFSSHFPDINLIAIMGFEATVSYKVMDKEFRRLVEIALGKALKRKVDESQSMVH